FCIIRELFCTIFSIFKTQESDLEKALKPIFPKATNKEIKRYKGVFSNVEELIPVLVIVPNERCINQHGQVAYDNVMNSFATFNLPANQRRDKNSMRVFHFEESEELYNTRDAIRTIHPNAFFVPPSLQAQIPGGQFEPVGTA
ncbi:7746_t:CDS:2, partial [Gigaspora rosea]